MASRAVKFGYYTCPECGAATVLKHGRKIPPYFAHRRGVGTEACENYHPQSGMQPHFPVPNTGKQLQEKYLKPKLTLSVTDSIDRLVFTLVYHLPKPKKPSGKISVNLGFSERKEIRLRDLTQPYRPFQLKIGQTLYGVSWCSPEVDHIYAEVVRGYLPGPNAKQITAFLESGELAQELEPNQTYFFLYNAQYMELTDELGSTLGHGQSGQWSVLKFKLSEDLDQGLINWLTKLSALEFTPFKVKFTPLDTDVLWGQSLRQVNLESNRKILFFAEKNESFQEVMTDIQFDDGSNKSEYQLDSDAFFEMQTNLPSKNDRAIVSFENSGFKAQLSPRLTVVKALPEAIFFSRDEGEASLASEKSVEFLNSMLEGKKETTLSVPENFPIRISVREIEDLVPYETELEMGEPCLQVSGNRTIVFGPVLDIIREKSSLVKVQLDGRGLGCISTIVNQSKVARAPDSNRENARLLRMYGRMLYSTAPAFVNIFFSKSATVEDIRYAVWQFQIMYPNHPHIQEMQRLM